MTIHEIDDGQTCSRCHQPHTDRRQSYCPACAETVRLEFGMHRTGGVRLDTHGDPDRPVRKMEVTR